MQGRKSQKTWQWNKTPESKVEVSQQEYGRQVGVGRVDLQMGEQNDMPEFAFGVLRKY